MARRIGLIGVPSSAGAHWPGQEGAPSALRAAGLIDRLRLAGLDVVDHGDLPRVRMQPDRDRRHPQNLGAVVDVARLVAERVAVSLRAGETPVVVGGDCTIEIGTISGFLHAGCDPALLYMDGGLDLRTPAENRTGILDSMGVAHLIDEPGVADALAEIGPRRPLLDPDRVVYFGYEPNVDAPVEGEIFARRGFAGYPAERVRHGPRMVAADAMADVEARAEHFTVHFDVDVIDFTDFPVADIPQHTAGLSLAEAAVCLGVFTKSPRFSGLTVTELNLDHADEAGACAETLALVLTDALAA